MLSPWSFSATSFLAWGLAAHLDEGACLLEVAGYLPAALLGGLWGIPFGLFIRTAWERLYLFGLFYFLAPVLALSLIFLPMIGAGYFGLRQGGPMFTASFLLVNLPFDIVTAVAARAIIGKQPWAFRTGEKPL